MKGRSSIALGFIALIVVGAILLSAPWAQASGRWGSLGVGLFTSCSAVCVTGLTVVDIAREYSFVGQIVLLVLVEVGCLGLMTCGTFLLVAVGRRLSLAREFSLMNAFGVAEIQGLRGLICWTVGSMLAVEAVGAAILWWRLRDVYASVFYSVMSFCNAGFGLRPDSLASFAHDPVVVLTMAAETILGGIGFLVIYDLCTCRFRLWRSGVRRHLSLHTRVVLRVTLWLILIGFIAFFTAECTHALAPFSGWRKVWVAFYQAVTPRTCGFTIVPVDAFRPLTRFFCGALMFVGGAPGSAAAGLKVTTLAVLLCTLRAMCRGENETVIMHRVVSYDVVRESIVIALALHVFVLLTTGALLVTEAQTGAAPDVLFFESLSAVTTTGLSVGDTTRNLTTAGRGVIMAAMFLGRLGALTVVMMIGDRESKSHIRYPAGELVVG